MGSGEMVVPRDVSPLETKDRPDTANPATAPALSLDAAQRSPSFAPRKQAKILFIAANADTDKYLALDEEHRAIERSLASSRHRHTFELITKLAARQQDLQQALLEHEPDIVHFACHGNVDAELMLVAQQGGAATVSPADLTAMVRALEVTPTLVVFNACWSLDQAAALRDTAALAIGMREPIDDAAAIQFASAFYNALGHGLSVRSAFECGKASMGSSHGEIPQLFEAANVHAHHVRFARPWWRRHTAAAIATVAGLSMFAAAGWAWSSAAPPMPETGPSAEMVRIPGATLGAGFGRVDRSRLPAACRAPDALEECAWSPGTSPSSAVVATFDLDRNEVRQRDFAAWLHTQATLWTLDPHGRVVTQQSPSRVLALVAPACGAGLILTPEGQLRAAIDQSDWPATCVTWYGADAYCRGQGKRLPLTTEWQLAAQGPENRLFPWGAELPRPDVVAFEQAEGANPHPRPVGTSPQDVTPRGVRDLAGNVGEWVDDGRGDARSRVIRGGTWASVGPCHLLAGRCLHKPAEAYLADVGFRCARSVLGMRNGRKESQ